MKNLFAKTTIALVMLSLLTFSCGKPKKGDVPPPENGATTTWTPKGNQKPIVTKSDIKNGDVGIVYSIVPAKPACVGGIWSLSIDAPPNAHYGAFQNTKKGGDVNFVSSFGLSVIDYAILSGFYEAASILYRVGNK